MGILGVERIDQKGVARLNRSRVRARIQLRRMEHFERNPPGAHRTNERLSSIDHASYSILQSTLRQGLVYCAQPQTRRIPRLIAVTTASVRSPTPSFS